MHFTFSPGEMPNASLLKRCMSVCHPSSSILVRAHGNHFRVCSSTKSTRTYRHISQGLPPKAHEPTGISAKREQTQTGHCQLAQKQDILIPTQPVTQTHQKNAVTINNFQKHKKQFNTQEAVQFCEK
jgi:hypothetical protein